MLMFEQPQALVLSRACKSCEESPTGISLCRLFNAYLWTCTWFPVFLAILNNSARNILKCTFTASVWCFGYILGSELTSQKIIKTRNTGIAFEPWKVLF